MSSGRRRPDTSAKIFSASSLGTADGLSARTSVSSRSGISSATETRYRLSMEMDFSPRSTSPMNLPERPERSPRRSWLSARCLRSARRRCPRNFLTCLTARSPMVVYPSTFRVLVIPGSPGGGGRGASRFGDGLGAAGHDREYECTLDAEHRVHAARWAPRVVARRAGARIVGDAALDDEDLLVAEVSVPRDHRAR